MPRYIPYMSVDSPEHVAGSLELRKIKNQLDEDLKTLNLTIDPESTPEKRKKAAKKLYSKYNKKRNKFSLNSDKDFEDLYIDPIILIQLHKELGELKDATKELLRKTMLNYANNSFLSPYYLQSPVKSNTLEGALEYFNVAKNATNEPFSTAAFMASPAFSSLLLGSLGYMASDKVAEDAGLTGTDKKITGIAGGVTTGLLSYLTHGAFKNIRKTLELVDKMKKGPVDVPYTELNSNLIKNTQKYLPANSKIYFLVTGNRPLLPAPKPTIITGRRNIVLSGFPNNRGEAYPALKFVTGNTGEFSHPTNIFRFTNSVGEEVVPTPYQGTSEQFDNAAMKGIQIGFKYRMSPEHRAKTKNTMNWDDLAMQEFINELNILAGGQIDYLPLKMTEEFTDRAQHSGKVFTKDGKVTGIVHTLKLNEDRLPTDRDVIEAAAHEMGGHGLTASIDVDSLDEILKKFFPRTYEVIQKDKELADLILVLKEGVDTSSPRYKYVRGSNELPTRVVTDNAFDAFGLSNLNNTSGFATTGVLELEDFFTSESLQKYKGEVLDTGVNTSRFYDPKDPELILAVIDAWNTRYPNSGLELIPPRDYRGYNNEPIKLIGILPFSQKVKDTAELMKLRWERYNYDKTHLGAMIDGNYLWTTNGINKFFEFLTSDGRYSRIYLPYNRNSNTTGFYGDLDGLWLKLYPERPKPYDYTQFHEGISHPTDRIVEKMTTPVAGKKVLEPVARLFGGVKYSNSMYGRISYPMDIYPQEMIDKYLSPSAQNPREARATNWEEIMKIYSEIAKKYNISYKDAITTKKDVFEKIIDNMSLNEFKNFLLRMDNAYVRDYVKLMNAGTEDLANLWLRRFKGALKYGPIVTGVIAGTAASNNRYGGKLIKRKFK